MGARAISGRKAAVFRSLSTPVQSGFTAMTWDATNKRATVGSNFWHHSDTYCVEVRMDGVLTGGNVTAGTATDVVQVAAITGYLAGATFTAAADSVASITKATTGSNRIVYAITYQAAGISSVAGTSGPASVTIGAAGGPPFIPVGSIALAFVSRLDTASTIVTAAEISFTSFGGKQWAGNPSHNEVRPLLGRLDFITLPGAVHTGSTYPAIYWRGYNFANNFAKIGQLKNWKIGITTNREEATTQNSGRDESDRGRSSHSFTADEYVSEIAPTAFDQENANEADIIVKMWIDENNATVTYYAAQMSLDCDFDIPQGDKSSNSVTGNITGYVEKFTA